MKWFFTKQGEGNKKTANQFEKNKAGIWIYPVPGFEFLMNVNLLSRLFCQFSFVAQSRCIWPYAVTKLCFFGF